MSGEQKYKEGDGPYLQWEASNRDELLVFTDKQQCYKTRLSDFDDTKASALGDYLPTKLAMEPEERAVWACLPGDYSGQLLFFFENGKAARVELSAYQTQTRRKKLTGAYSDKSPLAARLPPGGGLRGGGHLHRGPLHDLPHRRPEPQDHPLHPGGQRDDPETKYHVEKVLPLERTAIVNPARYRARSLPVAGALLKEEDRGEEQMTLL